MSVREKPSLLVVDDDPPIRKLIERIGVRAGFEVGLAKDGLEALEMLVARHYDIAVIDLMMPRLSGYELVQKISAMKPRPVILVATAMTNADVAKIDDTLVRGVIKKPFDIKAVAEALIETAKQIAQNETAVASGEQVVNISADDVLRHMTDEDAKKKLPNGDTQIN